MARDAQDEYGFAIEVHGFTCEDRGVVLDRLHRAFAASGCWTVGYRRHGTAAVEYNFEVELDAAMQLYCGLVETGLELTEVSHRALTDLCVLRSHERAERGSKALVPRVVRTRLTVRFVELCDEVEAGGVIAALA